MNFELTAYISSYYPSVCVYIYIYKCYPSILFCQSLPHDEMFGLNGLVPANLSTEGYTILLLEHPPGVYFGWAGLSARVVYKMGHEHRLDPILQ